MPASTTLLVPEQHLSRVAGLNQTLAGMAGIFIPPLGALAIDVATAIPAIVALLFIAIPQPARTSMPETCQPLTLGVGRPTRGAAIQCSMFAT